MVLANPIVPEISFSIGLELITKLQTKAFHYEEGKDDPPEDKCHVVNRTMIIIMNARMKRQEEMKRQNIINNKNLQQMYFLEMGQLITEQRMYDNEYIRWMNKQFLKQKQIDKLNKIKSTQSKIKEIEIKVRNKELQKKKLNEYSSIFQKQNLPNLAERETTIELYNTKNEDKDSTSKINTLRKIMVQNFHSCPTLKEDKYVQHNKNLIKKKIDHIGSDKDPPIKKI
jgi:hypothetical protein